jgi:hypothetical protein
MFRCEHCGAQSASKVKSYVVYTGRRDKVYIGKVKIKAEKGKQEKFAKYETKQVGTGWEPTGSIRVCEACKPTYEVETCTSATSPSGSPKTPESWSR